MTAGGEADKVRIRVINTCICITSYIWYFGSHRRFCHISGLDRYLSHIVEYLSRADMQPYLHRLGRS
jgi:hypothetical protein